MPLTTDVHSTDVSLDDGQSIANVDGWITLDTANADRIHLHLDDGATASAPAQYTLTVECYKARHGDWMFDSEYTGETARSWSLPALNAKTRINITNTSGQNGAQYRINAESIRSE